MGVFVYPFLLCFLCVPTPHASQQTVAYVGGALFLPTWEALSSWSLQQQRWLKSLPTPLLLDRFLLALPGHHLRDVISALRLAAVRQAWLLETAARRPPPAFRAVRSDRRGLDGAPHVTLSSRATVPLHPPLMLPPKREFPLMLPPKREFSLMLPLEREFLNPQ
ncbi:unnamed protein product [Closterium sp. NIES-54]